MSSKLIEIDFTYSGAIQVDLIGTLNLNLFQTAVVSNQVPLPGFLIRPGKKISGQGTGTQQNLPTASGIYQFFDTTHPQKTMNVWYYNLSGTNNNGGLWVQTSTIGTDHGWQFNTTANQLYFRLNSASTFSASPSGILAIPGWKMATVTIDRATSGINLYHNGVLVTGISGIPTNAGANATPIGVDRSGNNAIFYLATMQVFSGTLTSGEINSLYTNFLPDTITNAPFITMSGSVLDSSLSLVSGGRTCAYHHDSGNIHSMYNSVSGEYKIFLPTSGFYTVFSNTSGVLGGKALPAIVTSSGVVTFYDN